MIPSAAGDEARKARNRDDCRRYRERHAEKLKLQRLARDDAAKERSREADRRYRERHQERLKLKRLARDEAARSRDRDRHRDYRERHRERLNSERRLSAMTADRIALVRERNAAANRRWYWRTRSPAPKSVVTFRETLLRNDLYAIVDAAVPRTLSDAIRDDVISDLCIGLIEGAYTLDELPVKAVVQANWRALEWHRSVSFDAPDRYGRTLHDTLADAVLRPAG